MPPIPLGQGVVPPAGGGCLCGGGGFACGRIPGEHEWKGAREEVTRPRARLGPTGAKLGPNWAVVAAEPPLPPRGPGTGRAGGAHDSSSTHPPTPSPRASAHGAFAWPRVGKLWHGAGRLQMCPRCGMCGPGGCCSGREQDGTPPVTGGTPPGSGWRRCPRSRTMPTGRCLWGRAVTRFPGGGAERGGGGPGRASAALLPVAQRPLVPRAAGGGGGASSPSRYRHPPQNHGGTHSDWRSPPTPPSPPPHLAGAGETKAGRNRPTRVLPPPRHVLPPPPPPRRD